METRPFVVTSTETEPKRYELDAVKYAEARAADLSRKDAIKVAGYTGTDNGRMAREFEKRPATQKTMSEVFEKKARMALKRMTPSSMKGANVVQLATVAGIMSRNAREEREAGRPQAHVHLHIDLTKLSDEELLEHITSKSRATASDRN